MRKSARVLPTVLIAAAFTLSGTTMAADMVSRGAIPTPPVVEAQVAKVSFQNCTPGSASIPPGTPGYDDTCAEDHLGPVDSSQAGEPVDPYEGWPKDFKSGSEWPDFVHNCGGWGSMGTCSVYIKRGEVARLAVEIERQEALGVSTADATANAAAYGVCKVIPGVTRKGPMAACTFFEGSRKGDKWDKIKDAAHENACVQLKYRDSIFSMMNPDVSVDNGDFCID